MVVVVSYDIVSDRRRAKVCDKLKDYGRHVQYSVFECDLDERRLAELATELVTLICPQTDSIRFYRLCRSCAGRVEVRGRTFGP